MRTESIPWICGQLGAREHYAVPRALHRAGQLRSLHTDLWSKGPWSLFRLLGPGGKALADRYHPDLDQAQIRAYPWSGLARALAVRHARPDRFWERAVRHQVWFDLTVRAALLREAGLFHWFSYTGTFLECARALRERGALRILGQIDPAGTEERIVEEERSRWPGWEPEGLRVPESFRDRRRAEWEEADIIVVNSDWSRRALLEQGVPGSKLRVVPLTFQPTSNPAPPPPRGPRLQVLWLGQVLLRKGIAYLIEAARQLLREPVDILVVGGITITPEALRSAPRNLRFAGPVPRSETGPLFAAAEIFVLPTLSDGFAITQLEAMSHGLPVIATPCCGEVVIPGQNGLLVPPRDATALADAIASFVGASARLEAMSAAARATAGTFTLDRLRADLLGLVSAPP